MSFDAIRWAMRQNLKCTEKMVLVTLADAHNKHTGQCNLEKQTIAAVAGCCDGALAGRAVKAGKVRLRPTPVLRG